MRLRRPYTCINAATMWLDGRGPRPCGRARGGVEGPRPRADPRPAGTAATTGSPRPTPRPPILLGDLDAADRALTRAAELADGDLASLATTRRQLAMVCRELGRDTAVLDRIGPPRVIHYCGHMISPPGVPGRFPHDAEAKVAAGIAGSIADVGFAFGSLACGADILWAEALIDRGAELHVHLPCDASDFVAASVEVGGPGWRERFERCLAGGHVGRGHHARRAPRRRRALRLLLARRDGPRRSSAPTSSPAIPEQLAVWDGAPPIGVAGTAADVAAWSRTGHVTHVLASRTGAVPAAAGGSAEHSSRVVRAMLFADLRGFARLADAAAAVVPRHRHGPARRGHRRGSTTRCCSATRGATASTWSSPTS